jgi:hypothetical protein
MAKKIYWEAIGQEYRAGQLSVREIGRQHSVPESTIRTRAKAEGWKRDLAERVQAAIHARIPRSKHAPSTREECVSDPKEQEIDKAAATRTIRLVQIHRADAKRQREILRTLMEILRNCVPN